MNALGLNRDGNHRYSWNGDAKVPGITTVIKMLDKSDVLAGWAKRETAKAAIRNLDVLQRMVMEGGHENAVSWLKSMPGFQRDSAADVGTRVHAMAEAVAQGLLPEVATDILPYVEVYRRDFLDVYQPTFDPGYLEYMVYSEEHRYGGTLDVACVIGGEWWLLDYKSAADKPITRDARGFPYPETSMQLAAGRFAEFVGRPGDPRKYPLPQVTRCGVVAITRQRAELIEYHVTPLEFEAFLACRRLHTWVSERSKEVKAA